MNGKAYYNEINRQAAAILEARIADGSLPAGDVDTRSIEDVCVDHLRGYTSCHFFAGIGGWPLALRQAGWPDDRPVWTGSCPCQPFSRAGKKRGPADERHLWPAFYRLISQCRPSTVFGEQVTGPLADEWLDTVQVDMEAMAYAFGAVAFPAASVGAPQIRDRIYWLGHSETGQGWRQGEREASAAGSDRGLGGDYSTGVFWERHDWIVCSDGRQRPIERGFLPLAYGLPERVALLHGYGNAVCVPAARAFVSAFLAYHMEGDTEERAA